MAISLYTMLVVAVFAAALENCSALTDEKKAEIQQKLKPTLEACGKEHSITLENLADFKDQKKQPDDSNKCFFACVFKKIGLLDSKGLYSEDVALEKVSYYTDESNLEEAKQSVKACSSVNAEAVSDGEAGCDRAKSLFECIAKQRELLSQFGLA